jgi:hypothetical protein
MVSKFREGFALAINSRGMNISAQAAVTKIATVAKTV